jgi:2-iminobutanoate/2-iminopropanoate deaminase
MTKRVVKHPDKLASTGAYSAAVECDGWLFISGHASLNFKTGEPIRGSAGEETERTLLHIGRLLNEAGCSFDDVVKCTCHLARIEDFNEFNQAYAKFFPINPPARTTVQSTIWGGLKVEIDAIARIPRIGS